MDGIPAICRGIPVNLPQSGDDGIPRLAGALLQVLLDLRVDIFDQRTDVDQDHSGNYRDECRQEGVLHNVLAFIVTSQPKDLFPGSLSVVALGGIGRMLVELD
jgi:hypothetical protein